MGNKLSNHSESLNPLTIDGELIQPEDIHKVILKGYEIVIDRNLSFSTREKRIAKLYQKYSYLINPLYPHFYNFIRNSFNYEFFVFIGTIGNYAIDVVLYFDLLGWIVLNDRSCFRNYNIGGSNKLQYSVSKRKINLTAQEKSIIEAKKQNIEQSLKNEKFKQGPNIFVDTRCQPVCKIVEPSNRAYVNSDFWLKVSLKNWELSQKGKHYLVLIDGKVKRKIYHKDPISISLDNYSKGWHTISVVLVDESKCKTNFQSSIKVYLDPKSSSSSTTSSSSSTSSSDYSSSESSSDYSSSSESSSDYSSSESSSDYSSESSSDYSSSSESSSSNSTSYCSTCCQSSESSATCSTCCTSSETCSTCCRSSETLDSSLCISDISSGTSSSIFNSDSSSGELFLKKRSSTSSSDLSILKIIGKNKLADNKCKRIMKGGESNMRAKMAWLSEESDSRMSSEYLNRSKKLQQCARKILEIEMGQYKN